MISETQIDQNCKTLQIYITKYLINFMPTFLRLKNNVEKDNKIYAGLQTAPAGKFNHHSYPGGLIEHLLEMFEIHKSLNSFVNFSDSDVLESILLHDLHKAHLTFVYPDEEKIKEKPLKEGQWFEYGNHPQTSLMSNNEQTLSILMRTSYRVSSPLVMNALVASEGGYNKNPPKFVSSFAKYIYLLDEMSSNVIAREAKGNNVDVFNILKFENSWD